MAKSSNIRRSSRILAHRKAKQCFLKKPLRICCSKQKVLSTSLNSNKRKSMSVCSELLKSTKSART